MSSAGGVPTSRWSGLRTMAAMSWQLTADPARSARNSAVQWTTGTPRTRASASSRAVLGTTPAALGRLGQLGEGAEVADDPPLDLLGEHGGVARGGQIAQVDGHSRIRPNGSGWCPAAWSSDRAGPEPTGPVIGRWTCAARRCRSPRGPRPRSRQPTGSRACRWGSARWTRPRGAGGAPCSRRCASRQWTWMSSSVGCLSARGWMMAATRCPHRSSGAPDHDGVEHLGMRAHGRLDLLGEDLLATRVDGDRSPAEQGDGAVGLDGGEVTGHHVPDPVDVDEDLGRLDRVVVVARPGCRRSGRSCR